jgi:hypothetical protein
MCVSRAARRLRATWLVAFFIAVATARAGTPRPLFYVSGDRGTTADAAAEGTAEPTFDTEVSVIPDGAKGSALRCGDLQRLAWRAPGNIYAQRGTLSFFWRSRYPVGPTEFPIFRVGYADHSSWDMVWLRIDYNGDGFDAFVTDVNLARTRVAVKLPRFPQPNEWTHLALAWDETRGIRFYVNGQLAGKVEATAVYDAGLDQFGPHSRIISPHNVQSDYNFVRGGDIDEIRIYGSMLDDDAIARLAKGNMTEDIYYKTRSLANAQVRDEWYHRYGWDHGAPPELPAANTAVRKVEITDAYDLKRWWWKANDGIPETTWPGVYNRSRLPGRHDYFTLPDWDCYVDSGQAVTFALPDEPWNHVEISGAAWGTMELLPSGTALETASDAKKESVLFERPKGAEKTVHALARPLTGRQIRFTNGEQEQPIGELSVYNVTAGTEPKGSATLALRLAGPYASVRKLSDPGLGSLPEFIAGRHPVDEEACEVARPAEQPLPFLDYVSLGGLPLVHVLIPNAWDQRSDGLNGLALDLPALKLKPTHGEVIAFNVQVKDPLWPARNLLDFSFSVKPGEAHTLWLDLRDRLLPAGQPLYLTIASASPEFNELTLFGANLRLVFKSRDAARPEHETDRFTQAKDAYAMLVEEHPHSPKLNLWVRFEQDLNDLLRVNPDHRLGRQYAAAAGIGAPPPFVQPVPPAGAPLWAFRQVELLTRVKRFVLWYIDHRQSAYGDFGGGISDDVDLLNTWPGVALMGAEPEKIQRSLHALLEAAYRNGMFTNGLPTIQADELHSYEEGINCLAQNLILEYGSPRQLERAMTTARGVEGITGINAAGHRHIRSSYYSGTRMAEEDPWNRSKPYSYLVLQPGQLLVDFNGSPTVRRYNLELADGLLAHRRKDEAGRYGLPTAIVFPSDQDAQATRGYLPTHLFWGAWKWTGDRRYLDPIFDAGVSGIMGVNANALDLLGVRKEWGERILAGEKGRATETRPTDGRGPARATANNRSNVAEHFLWQLTGDKAPLEKAYAAQIQECDQMEYINTEGSLWIDRVGVPIADLQRARLGGVALVRNGLYPGHVVSWKFAAPATDRSVAILVADATGTAFKVIACNLDQTPVRATMTGWNIDPGQWAISQGIDRDGDDQADGPREERMEQFERSRSIELTLAPAATTVLTFKLKTPGTPYWSRPDLGLDPEDVVINRREVRVTVHNVGSVPSPATDLAFRDVSGAIVARGTVPALAAPVDLGPKTAIVELTLPAGVAENRFGGVVEIDPDHRVEEITTANNRATVTWP